VLKRQRHPSPASQRVWFVYERSRTGRKETDDGIAELRGGVDPGVVGRTGELDHARVRQRAGDDVTGLHAGEPIEIADDDDLSYGEKLAGYRKLVDDYFDTERYQDFWSADGDRFDQIVLDWVAGPAFDDLLTQTVRSVYPEAEHDHFIAHLRGLTSLWVRDEVNRTARQGL